MTIQPHFQISAINESQITTPFKVGIHKTNENNKNRSGGRVTSKDTSKNEFNLNSVNKQKEEISFKFEFKSTKNNENNLSSVSRIETFNPGGIFNFIIKAAKKLFAVILNI
jgi:hypothetical protein